MLGARQKGSIVTLTDKGVALKEKAVGVPLKMSSCIGLDAEETQTLYSPLYKLIGGLDK